MKHLYLTCLGIFFISVIQAGNDNTHFGARSAALGNASVTLSDVWSAHHNQAGLGFITKACAGVSYENRFLVPELGLSGAVVALPLKEKRGTFGLSIRKFGYSQYSESKIGLGFGRAFGEHLSIGMQINYQNVQFADVYGSKTAFTVEAGAIYKLSPVLTVAAHVFNPNRSRLTELDQDRLPVAMRFGLRYQFSNMVFIAAETEKDSYNKPVFRAGIEYMAGSVLYLRAGMGSQPISSSFGFGLKLKKLQIDMAGNFHPVLGFSPQFSLTYQFRD